MLVRAINQKPLLGILPNSVCISIVPSFQHLLMVSDLDLHLQGHLGADLHGQSRSHFFIYDLQTLYKYCSYRDV